jgi:ABC-type multidrug transport system ATPase subunit
VKAVMGLVPAQRLRCSLKGMVLTERTPLRVWRRHIWGKMMTLVFQHADEALNLESSVRSVFAGLPSMKGASAPSVADILSGLFDAEDIPVLLTKKVKHLSGGQKQRLNLLRGLSLNTDVLILDEPLNGLDFESAGRVIAKLQQQQQVGKAILLISHNEEIFDRLVPAEQVYYLHARESANPSHQNDLGE